MIMDQTIEPDETLNHSLLGVALAGGDFALGELEPELLSDLDSDLDSALAGAALSFSFLADCL